MALFAAALWAMPVLAIAFSGWLVLFVLVPLLPFAGAGECFRPNRRRVFLRFFGPRPPPAYVLHS